MSAAVNPAVSFPGISAAADLTLEAPPAVDIEITIYGGLDPYTEELVENARRAAEKLSREYGVYAVVVPNTVYWQTTMIGLTPFTYPILVINGKEVSRGEILDVDEIVSQALAMLGVRGREEPALLPAKREDRLGEVGAVW